MNRTSKFAGALFTLALLAGLAVAQDAGKKIVNRKCPLKPDARVDTAQTMVYKGKVIGFCCSDCTDKFKANPAAYAAAIKEDAHLPEEPEGFASAKEALEAAKGGGYLCVILFVPKTGTSPLLAAISDVSIKPEIENCAFAKVEFNKDSAEAKALKVTAANTLVLVDARPEAPKVIKALTSGAAPVVLKEIQAARKEMEK
jgi:YHS domain-containing protein